MIKPKCLVFDLDFTLSHFTDNYDGFFKIFVERGIDKSIARKIYEEVKKTGFSFVAYLTKLESEKLIESKDRKQIEKSCEEWLRGSLELYPDAKKFIFKSNACPLVILTFGNPDFQKQKIQSLGLGTIEHFAVASQNEKPQVIKRLLERYGSPIIALDDKASDLDRIRIAGIGEDLVTTIRVLRPNSPYREEKPKFTHKTIYSLAELKFCLP